MYAAAVQEMHDSLGTTSEQFSLSISVFILLQGAMPLAWTAISEVKGRKVSRTKSHLGLTIIACSAQVVYLISLTLFTASSVAVALSPDMNRLVIAYIVDPCVNGSAA